MWLQRNLVLCQRYLRDHFGEILESIDLLTFTKKNNATKMSKNKVGVGRIQLTVMPMAFRT